MNTKSVNEPVTDVVVPQDEMPAMDKAAFETSAVPQVEPVTLKRLGKKSYVRVMCGTHRDLFDKSNIKEDGDEVVFVHEGYRARLWRFTVCDQAGKLLFTDADIPWLGTLNSLDMQPVTDKAREMNGLGPKAKADRVKN